MLLNAARLVISQQICDDKPRDSLLQLCARVYPQTDSLLSCELYNKARNAACQITAGLVYTTLGYDPHHVHVSLQRFQIDSGKLLHPKVVPSWRNCRYSWLLYAPLDSGTHAGHLDLTPERPLIPRPKAQAHIICTTVRGHYNSA